MSTAPTTDATDATDARARFAAATDAHLRAPLSDEVSIRHVPAAEWHAAADPLWAQADDRPAIPPGQLLSDDERQQRGQLDALLGAPLEHRLLLEAGDQVIGAYWGVQEHYGRYYMVSTTLVRAWQRRGLYRALLPRVVAAADQAGFVEVWSRHRADNNAVLVPKLRAGFHVTGFEVSPRWGLLVHLRRHLRERMAALYRWRVDGNGAAQLRERGVELP